MIYESFEQSIQQGSMVSGDQCLDRPRQQQTARRIPLGPERSSTGTSYDHRDISGRRIGPQRESSLMKYYIPVILVLVLLLGGCAGQAAKAIAFGTYLEDSAISYVKETHDLRKFVREECRASLVREIEELRQSGSEQDLRVMLASIYPKLVTIEIVTTARDNPGNLLSRPLGCGIE